MLKKLIFLAILCASFSATLNARAVLDSDGKPVQIPDRVELATPMIGAFVQMSAMLGNQERIVSGAARLPALMSKVFPKIRTNANPSGMLGSSVETLISSGTQVVFGPVGMMFDNTTKKQLERAGIAVVKIDQFATTAQIQQCLLLIADIFGEESVARAREFNAYFNENIAYVRSRTADLPRKKRVLVLNYNAGAYRTISAHDIGAEYIAIAGGESVSAGLETADFKLSQSLNEEQVIIFDPDVIITNSLAARRAILANPAFAKLAAIRAQQVFVNPGGVYLWSVRSAEGALQPLWLAKILYPEHFGDLDLAQKVREFYARFYDYELSEAELNGILNPAR